MSELAAGGDIGKPLIISYKGLEADEHRLEISDLSTSLRGLGRIFTVAGTFAANQKLMERSSARPVRILVGPPKEGSVTFWAAMTWLDQHSFVGATVSGLTATLITYIFKRAAGQKEEMKHLAASLETAIRELGHRDDAVVSGLLETINRMADILKPAAKQAVAPIGRTAGTLTIGEKDASGGGIVVDKPMRDAIEATDPPEIGDEVQIAARFVEMNLKSNSCRIETELGEAPAEVTDPEFLVPNNAYALAFAAKTILTVRAKPTMRGDAIERWYISGHA